MTMPEFSRTPGISDDDEHWDALAQRIAVSARGTESGLYWLATARGAWVASSLLAAVGLIASLSSINKPADASSPGQLSAMLAPGDKVGETIVLSDKPPDIGMLLLPQRATSAK